LVIEISQLYVVSKPHKIPNFKINTKV